MGTEWNGDYVSPYAEHGKKSEQVKKITVSILPKVLKVLTDERTCRQGEQPASCDQQRAVLRGLLHASPASRCPVTTTCARITRTASRRGPRHHGSAGKEIEDFDAE